MIKEIFDIEPIQKNSLIIFLALFCISFLQIFLFKPVLFEKSVFIVIGISLSLTVSWIILSLPSILMFFFMAEWSNEKQTDNSKLIFENIVFIFGMLIITWTLLLTYISYELNLSFKNLIRLGIAVSIIKFIVWFITHIIGNLRNKKSLKK